MQQLYWVHGTGTLGMYATVMLGLCYRYMLVLQVNGVNATGNRYFRFFTGMLGFCYRNLGCDENMLGLCYMHFGSVLIVYWVHATCILYRAR